MRKLIMLSFLFAALPGAALAAAGGAMPHPSDVRWTCGAALIAGVGDRGDARLVVRSQYGERQTFTIAQDQFGVAGAAGSAVGSRNKTAVGYLGGTNDARMVLTADRNTPCWKAINEGRKAYADAYDVWAADQTLAGGDGAWKPKFTRVKSSRPVAPKQTEK
jgi:hypothetical protein